MENEKPNYYAIIPANVRYDKRLKPIERLLYGEITCLANKEGFCFASSSYFAKLYDCSRETISRYISNLSRYGYITISLENNYQRKIYIGCDRNITGGYDRNITGGYDKTITHNNINNNIINNNRLIDYNKFNLQEIFKEKNIYFDDIDEMMSEKSKRIFLDMQAVVTEIYHQPTYKKYINDFDYDDIVDAYEKWQKYKSQVKNPYTYMARIICDKCRKRVTA